MQNKELKSVIKQLVRESLVEIFVEMNLQTIVEGVVKSQLSQVKEIKEPKRASDVPVPKLSKSIRDLYMEQEEDSNPYTSVEAPKRSNILDSVKDSTLRSVLSDTLNSNNPILNESASENSSKPELVPEHVLESAGLMKDYSRLAGLDKEDSTIPEEDDEWEQRRKSRQQILQSTIKR